MDVRLYDECYEICLVRILQDHRKVNNNRRFLRRFKHRRFFWGPTQFVHISQDHRTAAAGFVCQIRQRMSKPCHFHKCIERSLCDVFTVFIY